MTFSFARIAIIGTLLSLAACATHPRTTTVGMHMFLPDGAKRYALQQDERFLMPVPIGNPLPALPAGIADQEWITTTVCVEVVVGAEGNVVSAAPLATHDSCTAASSGVPLAFMEAALKAVRSWTYFGAAICRPASPDDENCDRPDAVVNPVAVKLAYAFTFERSSDGGATVRANSLHGSPSKK